MFTADCILWPRFGPKSATQNWRHILSICFPNRSNDSRPDGYGERTLLPGNAGQQSAVHNEEYLSTWNTWQAAKKKGQQITKCVVDQGLEELPTWHVHYKFIFLYIFYPWPPKGSLWMEAGRYIKKKKKTKKDGPEMFVLTDGTPLRIALARPVRRIAPSMHCLEGLLTARVANRWRDQMSNNEELGSENDIRTCEVRAPIGAAQEAC